MTTKLSIGQSIRQPVRVVPRDAPITGSIRTLYCNNPQQSSASAGLLDPTAPPASTSTTGWTVGTTVATRYSAMTYNAEVPATGFTTTIQPSGGPITTNGHKAEDCFRTSAVTSGVFSRGTWYSSLSLIAVTNASSQDGRARFRLWRSTDAAGANAVEITDPSRPMIGTTTGALSTSVAASSIASTWLPTVVLSGEYLFLQVGWETTVAGTNAGADALLRFGSLFVDSGSGVVTSAFSATILAAGGSASGAGYVLRKRRDALVGAWDMDEI